MQRVLGTVLVSLWLCGCAAYWHAHTEGRQDPLAWYVTEARSEAHPTDQRYAYTFRLVVQETQGTALTMQTLTYTVYSGTATHAKSQEQTLNGPWLLRPHGTLRFPFTYTVSCLDKECIKLDALAPTYHMVLLGTDQQGHTVRVVMDLKLPPDPTVLPRRRTAWQAEKWRTVSLATTLRPLRA